MNIYILEAIRAPRGKAKADGALHSVLPAKLLGKLYQELHRRTGINQHLIDEVFTGCVTPIGDQGGNIGHVAMRLAGINCRNTGITLSSFCSSSLSTLSLARSRMLAGEGSLYISAGVESMSRVPLMSDKPYGFVDPEASQAIPVMPNPLIADIIATRNGYTRKQLDSYALNSHRKAAKARDSGRFKRSLIPIEADQHQVLLDHDEAIKAETTLERLSTLPPLFGDRGIKGFERVLAEHFPNITSINHVHHAGNAPGMVDGASVILLGTADRAEQLGIKPRARLVDICTRSAPSHLGLAGAAAAARHLLEKNTLTSADIDLWEFNEGFAAIACDFRDQLEIPDDRLNVNGSGIAMGHAMGATGGNIISILCDELERQDLKRGLVAISGAMGAGAAALIERP
ncbi:MAG: acetyl-CoA C-acyltransferase [Halieaceae bacterium]|nr:acetyl-CoA C-acyltransferase [Halieaceae bacterium]